MRRSRASLQLEVIPAFAGCSRKVLARVEQFMTRVEVCQGGVLVNEGGASRECFLILAGNASVRRAGVEIAVLGPGDWVGETGVVRHALRNATVVATTPVSLAAMTPRELRSVLGLLPVVSARLESVAARGAPGIAPSPA